MYVNAHIRVTATLDDGTEVILPNIVSVKISNDSQHIGATCDITVPVNSRIKYGFDEKTQEQLSAPIGGLFQTGDAVKVEAKYDGYEWLTLFEGFMFDFFESMPLRIVCYDYIYKLNYVSPIAISFPPVLQEEPKSIPLVFFLNIILTGTGIKLKNIDPKYTNEKGELVDNPLVNMNLTNISFVNMTPAAILEHLKKELGFNISLDKNYLYVNLASNTTNTAVYDSRLNVKTDGMDLQPNTTKKVKNLAKKNNSIFQRIKVKAHFYNQTTGKKETIDYGDEGGQVRDVFFYNIDVSGKTDEQKTILYKKIASEAFQKFYQRRFAGGFKAYLYPDVDLFYRVEYTDYSYPERSGVYSVTAQEIILDGNGFERNLKLSYLGEIN